MSSCQAHFDCPTASKMMYTKNRLLLLPWLTTTRTWLHRLGCVKKHWCTFWVAPKQADTHIHRQPFGGHYNHYHHHHLPNHHHRTAAAASQRQRRIIVQMFSSVRQWDSFKAKSMEFSRVIDHDDHLVAKAAGMALSLKHNMLMTQPKMICCQQAVLRTLCRVEK